MLDRVSGRMEPASVILLKRASGTCGSYSVSVAKEWLLPSSAMFPVASMVATLRVSPGFGRWTEQ